MFQTVSTSPSPASRSCWVPAGFAARIRWLTPLTARLLTSTVANLLCTIAAALMAFLPRSNTWGRLVCFWLTNAQSVGFTISLTTISSNMAGFTHRSFASALIL